MTYATVLGEGMSLGTWTIYRFRLEGAGVKAA